MCLRPLAVPEVGREGETEPEGGVSENRDGGG
jgi:hypothetical protein